MRYCVISRDKEGYKKVKRDFLSCFNSGRSELSGSEASGPGVSFRRRKLPGDRRPEVSLAEVSPSNVTGNELFDLDPQPAPICRLKALENRASEKTISNRTHNLLPPVSTHIHIGKLYIYRSLPLGRSLRTSY